MNVRYRAHRIAWCTLTPRFIGILCTITLGFLVFVSTVLGYLYSNTPGFLIFLAYFFLLLVVFFVVCIGFDLRGSTFLGFLVDYTTSFQKSTSLSGSTSKRACPRT